MLQDDQAYKKDISDGSQYFQKNSLLGQMSNFGQNEIFATFSIMIYFKAWIFYFLFCYQMMTLQKP